MLGHPTHPTKQAPLRSNRRSRHCGSGAARTGSRATKSPQSASALCGGTRERRRLALDADSMLGSRAPDNPRGRLATTALCRLGIHSSSCSRSRAWAQDSTRCSALAQLIALAGVTLVAAAALAWHRYTLLILLTYSGGALWRSTRTRCSAQGRLTALAGVTLAAARGCVGLESIRTAALALVLGRRRLSLAPRATTARYNDRSPHRLSASDGSTP